eukprot:CAMPEP_0117031412 /NCGR_PEP_ID=MMETSP0472-20121206/22580_1 /TAXON_ID=693140 ORGANISM="Tiarina fusus, Strain LIS" /NCGR_SAMPLE_ID=MMETSP0472 /ASSEMBLY_ACC=CAM_ASM_000603 /LENGTH=274 /DNA_ID=CAMNT_0004739731 /DNA_START=35 /DNA_END=860 /DNA_ORIENTATION=+
MPSRCRHRRQQKLAKWKEAIGAEAVSGEEVRQVFDAFADRFLRFCELSEDGQEARFRDVAVLFRALNQRVTECVADPTLGRLVKSRFPGLVETKSKRYMNLDITPEGWQVLAGLGLRSSPHAPGTVYPVRTKGLESKLGPVHDQEDPEVGSNSFMWDTQVATVSTIKKDLLLRPEPQVVPPSQPMPMFSGFEFGNNPLTSGDSSGFGFGANPLQAAPALVASAALALGGTGAVHRSGTLRRKPAIEWPHESQPGPWWQVQLLLASTLLAPHSSV